MTAATTPARARQAPRARPHRWMEPGGEPLHRPGCLPPSRLPGLPRGANDRPELRTRARQLHPAPDGRPEVPRPLHVPAAAAPCSTTSCGSSSTPRAASSSGSSSPSWRRGCATRRASRPSSSSRRPSRPWRSASSGASSTSPMPATGLLNASSALSASIRSPGSAARRWVNASLIIAGIWGSVGFVTVILSAALKGISTEILEAARVDGATEGQIFRRIIVPMLSLPDLGRGRDAGDQRHQAVRPDLHDDAGRAGQREPGDRVQHVPGSARRPETSTMGRRSP